MAIPVENIIECVVKLHLSKQATEKLTQRAANSGRDVAAVASDLIEQAITQPTIDEVLAPFRKQVADSGMSDRQLDEMFQDIREKAFEDRQRRPA